MMGILRLILDIWRKMKMTRNQSCVIDIWGLKVSYPDVLTRSEVLGDCWFR